MSRLFLLLTFTVLFDLTFSITFYLPVNLRKCLREEIHKDVLVTGEYEVSEQPNAKTNLKITDSSGHILYSKEDASKGKFAFTTEDYDMFEVCFESKSPLEQHKLALTRIERVGGPGAQLSKRTSTLVSSLRNGCITSPQLVTSLNNTCKTPVSTSTVKRLLRDAGLLGRFAKKKPYLRLAKKSLKYGFFFAKQQQDIHI
uniref:GOLD domain-containing protein n=1 Tax=Oncorhynchus tshawytscha TaxID=74940 RepID=A0AAZ3PN74_ONCTS